MASQKYTGMKIRRLTAVVTARYHQLYPATTALTSNVGQYPIDVTLGDNPNYSVVSTNGILSVTQKYCCNSSQMAAKVVWG
jgi:hypothetical protein